MSIELLAYRPLRKRPKLTVLITAIGVSLFLEYGGQHEKVFGAATKTFPDLLPRTNSAVGGDRMFPVTMSWSSCSPPAAARPLWFIVQRTKIGTAMRAVSFNDQAAALMGVNNNIVISFTFGLGSALAAAGGILYAMN